MSPPASLWPSTFQIEEVPEPVKILREQADTLKLITQGLLYGEVIKPHFNLVKSVTYDFYIGAEEKMFRHKLFSIEYQTLFVYPVKIRDYGSGTTTQVENISDFIEQVRSLLGSDETKRVINRLLEISK